MNLSLRLLLPIVLTVSIAVMVGIIVKLQHDTDSDILRQIALGDTLAFAQKFQNEVENFLNIPTDMTVAIQDAVKVETPALPLPSMARTQNDIEHWKRLAYRPLLHQNPIYPDSVGIFLTDGTMVRGKLQALGGDQVLLSYFYAPNLGPPFTNFTTELRNLPSLSNYRGNMTLKLGKIDVNRVPIVRKITAMDPKPLYYLDFSVSVTTSTQPRMNIAAVATLYNSTGGYIGLTAIPFDITDISQFLRLHSNDATAFIIIPQENASETELVLGTPSEPTVSFTIVNASEDITVPANCQSSAGFEASVALGCRRLVTEYPYAPLKASLPYLSLSSCLAMPVEGVAHMMHHNNREYAVVIRRISTLAAQTPDALLTMIVFYDLTTVQKEVHDRLQKSLWICVGVSLALALLLSGFLQWTLLPLSRLVRWLASASHLQSRTRSDRRSRIQEFRDLEDAFIHLHENLKRLKSHIPPNLLVSTPIQRHAAEPTSRPDVFINKRLAVSRLMEQINTFRSTDVSVMIVQCAVAQTMRELAAQASMISRTVIEAAEKYNGIVEKLYPSKCIVSFNAHSPCPAHQEQAALCAVRTHRKLVQFLPELLHFIFVDTAAHAVGPCGFGESTSRIIIGPCVELAHSVFRLMRSYLVQSRVLLTDHAARVIRSVALVPVDVITLTQSVEEGTRVVLYEPCVRVPFTSEIRGIFVTMMQGQFANARAAIETEIKNNPAFAAHLKRWMENCEHFTKTGTSALERKNAPHWDAMENPLAAQAIEKHDAATKVHEYAAEVLKPKEFEEGGLFGIVAIDDDDTEIPRRVSDVQGTEWLRSISRIGEGSFSSVYKGISNAGRWSAMKFVRLESEADVSRIGNELQVLTSLIHPNVAQFISYAMHGSFIVLISEYLRDTLSEEIKQFGVPFPDRLLYIAYDILKGLEYIHHRGIVHCDLKPANILISNEGTCKLCDFGSSLQGAAASCSDVTELRGSAVYTQLTNHKKRNDGAPPWNLLPWRYFCSCPLHARVKKRKVRDTANPPQERK